MYNVVTCTSAAPLRRYAATYLDVTMEFDDVDGRI